MLRPERVAVMGWPSQWMSAPEVVTWTSWSGGTCLPERMSLELLKTVMTDEPAPVLARNTMATIVTKVTLRLCWKGFGGSQRGLLLVGNWKQMKNKRYEGSRTALNI